MKVFSLLAPRGALFAAAGVALLVCLIASCAAALTVEGTARVEFSRTYQFLVRDCDAEAAAAVSGEVSSLGGAGYYLQAEGESAVVLAVYPDEASAHSVLDGMKDEGEGVRLLALAAQPFSVRGGAEQAARVLAQLRTLDTCASLLYRAANGLATGEFSQAEARAAADGVRRVLEGLAASSGEGEIGDLAEACRSLASGILFSRDVRRVQAEICAKIVSAHEIFA